MHAVTPMGEGTPMGVKLQKISRYVILKLIAPISDRDTLFLFGLGSTPATADQFCEIRPHPLSECLGPSTLSKLKIRKTKNTDFS